MPDSLSGDRIERLLLRFIQLRSQHQYMSLQQELSMQKHTSDRKDDLLQTNAQSTELL
ncbi:hypothetical protein AM1_4142 [Acaryochloris marina MBIC11017]|uniref:Uncharacterized protein n=1 Tax=Acaryochloris marina (strain MBIC 11017) TaxID=329726 RepID=B0CBK5_ACAM1|nr:hypothetical protein AM1_4142 [Acaryochloris marina MBIC11017]